MIGRQVDTAFGGRIDLLTIGAGGALSIVEMKRHKTPRDIVAQVLDYALGFVAGHTRRLRDR